MDGGGGKKPPPPQFYAAIWCLTTMELGRNRVYVKNFSRKQQKIVTSKALSEYDVISNFSPLVPSKMRFFRNFFISQPIELKFGTGIQNWMLILTFGSKKGFGDDLRQYDTKPIILCYFLAKRLLDIAMPWQHLKSQVIKNYLKGCFICSN